MHSWRNFSLLDWRVGNVPELDLFYQRSRPVPQHRHLHPHGSPGLGILVVTILIYFFIFSYLNFELYFFFILITKKVWHEQMANMPPSLDYSSTSQGNLTIFIREKNLFVLLCPSAAPVGPTFITASMLSEYRFSEHAFYAGANIEMRGFLFAASFCGYTCRSFLASPSPSRLKCMIR